MIFLIPNYIIHNLRVFKKNITGNKDKKVKNGLGVKRRIGCYQGS